MAGHAWELIDIDAELICGVASFGVGVSFDDEVDFCFDAGFMMVNTFVFEPNAPSMDIVSQHGAHETRLLLLLATGVLLAEPGDLDMAVSFDCERGVCFELDSESTTTT